MSIYNGKLLELKGFAHDNNEYFLQVKLSLDQDIEFSWKIDEYTFNSLRNLVQFDEKHRYRLSLNGSWNLVENQYTSTFSQTYCDQSYVLNFLCSEDYMNQLNIIRNCQDIDSLDKQFFFPLDLPMDDELREENEDKHEVNISKNHVNHFRNISIAIMSIFFILFFSYLNRGYLNRTALNENALAESIQSDKKNSEIKEEDLDLNGDIAADTVIEVLPLEESIVIPSIELEDLVTYSIPEGKVALTFDDGPSQYSLEIMNLLENYKVGGTFFFIGYNIKKYPSYIQSIKANGYSIGSHSMNHFNMNTLSYDKQKSELIKSIQLLEELTNEKITLFRPPYGSFNEHTKNLIHDNEYKMVLWNNDPRDWESRDADKIFNFIENASVSGSIILLHESQAVIDALPRIIEYLLALDLEIINLQ